MNPNIIRIAIAAWSLAFLGNCTHSNSNMTNEASVERQLSTENFLASPVVESAPDLWAQAEQKALSLFDEISEFEQAAELVRQNKRLFAVHPSHTRGLNALATNNESDLLEDEIFAYTAVQRLLDEHELVSAWSAKYTHVEPSIVAYVSFVMSSERANGWVYETYMNRYFDPDVTDIEIRANSCRAMAAPGWYFCVRQ